MPQRATTINIVITNIHTEIHTPVRHPKVALPCNKKNERVKVDTNQKACLYKSLQNQECVTVHRISYIHIYHI